MLNGIALSANKISELIDDSTVLVGGEVGIPYSLCQLECKITGKSSPALFIRLNAHSLALMNGLDRDKNINQPQVWDSMDVDLVTNWTLIGSEIDLGINKQGNIDFGCVEGGKALAKLVYDDGFYLSPITETIPSTSPEIELTLNNEIVYSLVPLQDGFTASINGCQFSFKSVA